MSPKTVCSCAANPFTVSTRFGIKSARRCRTTSTWDHAAFTASRFTTIWFLRLTNELPSSSATTSKTTRTIRAFFISASNQLNLRMRILHARSEEHTSELQSRFDLVCRLLLEKKNLRDLLAHQRVRTHA